MSCATAIAKLIVTMPSPVLELSGETNSPRVIVEPKVMARIRQAAATRPQGMCVDA